ncbi:MAG: histidinol-phosphate transaminase [Candidatus Omnitrophota bacterium]
MKNRYKPHLLKIVRKRTSVGRDLDEGVRLDRNERVIDFSDHVIKDIYNSVSKYALNVYPDLDNLYKKLSQWIGVASDEVYITNGITEAMRVVFETLINPGDRMVGISPTYPMYSIYAQIYQADWYTVKFSKDLQLNIKELCAAIDDATVLVWLPNPNLPIESLFGLDEIRTLAEKCKKCGSVLVIDEAYYFFGSVSAIPLIKDYNNLIIFQTFSKALGLAGARIGYMVSNKENIEYLSKTRSLVELNGISAAIGEYIIDHPEIMNQYVHSVEQGRVYVKNELQKLGLRYYGGNATNGMLIFLQDQGDTEDLLAVLKKQKIYLRGSFDFPIDNCLRLTLGPREAMEIFVKALGEWVLSKSVR